MAFNQHVAERNRVMKIIGGINFGIQRGILVDADLTSATAAKAAVDADVAVMHVSERLAGVRTKAAIDMADSISTNYTTSSDADLVYSADDAVSVGIAPVL